MVLLRKFITSVFSHYSKDKHHVTLGVRFGRLNELLLEQQRH